MPQLRGQAKASSFCVTFCTDCRLSAPSASRLGPTRRHRLQRRQGGALCHRTLHRRARSRGARVSRLVRQLPGRERAPEASDRGHCRMPHERLGRGYGVGNCVLQGQHTTPQRRVVQQGRPGASPGPKHRGSPASGGRERGHLQHGPSRIQHEGLGELRGRDLPSGRVLLARRQRPHHSLLGAGKHPQQLAEAAQRERDADQAKARGRARRGARRRASWEAAARERERAAQSSAAKRAAVRADRHCSLGGRCCVSGGRVCAGSVAGCHEPQRTHGQNPANAPQHPEAQRSLLAGGLLEERVDDGSQHKGLGGRRTGHGSGSARPARRPWRGGGSLCGLGRERPGCNGANIVKNGGGSAPALCGRAAARGCPDRGCGQRPPEPRGGPDLLTGAPALGCKVSGNKSRR
mmetsp:Transcript_15383/g.58161  ORF Transcript_15383/g.58161 Transcript_15383/m.58161 type:complete len:406 (-) Transcript_15383:908-2125(-)